MHDEAIGHSRRPHGMISHAKGLFHILLESDACNMTWSRVCFLVAKWRRIEFEVLWASQKFTSCQTLQNDTAEIIMQSMKLFTWSIRELNRGRLEFEVLWASKKLTSCQTVQNDTAEIIMQPMKSMVFGTHRMQRLWRDNHLMIVTSPHGRQSAGILPLFRY